MGGIDWQCGIDTYSRSTTYSRSIYEECSECGGTGKDNKTLDGPCWKCNGLGEIKKRDD